MAGLGYDVKFLCQTHFGRKLDLVERICLKGSLSHEFLVENFKSEDEQTQHRAEQYRLGMLELSKNGWDPNTVISHSGWGCGLHVKEIWDYVYHISYVEWWFDPRCQIFSYDPKNPYLPTNRNLIPKLWKRNQSMALELSSANKLITPTKWQRMQIPKCFRDQCQVIFDGVNEEEFKPDFTLRSKKPLLTYGTRGMEPIRCFKEFIKELPPLIEKIPDLSIEIAGYDRINYGGKAPSGFKSWGSWAKKYLKKMNSDKNVHWVGVLPKDKYINWLQRSWCHVYLTQPYVASWSLVEALFCKCNIIASNTKPIEEFAHFPNLELIDHRKEGFLKAALKYLENNVNNDVKIELAHLTVNSASREWISACQQGLELRLDKQNNAPNNGKMEKSINSIR